MVFSIWAKCYLFSVKRKIAPLYLYYLSHLHYTELDYLSLEKLVCTVQWRIQLVSGYESISMVLKNLKET